MNHTTKAASSYDFCLTRSFQKLNVLHFDSFLEPPNLIWNSRLRSSAGRFIPGIRSGPWSRSATIEIASYLRTEAHAEHLIQDTLGHEMIHYWLWVRKRPFGHTPEFKSKMRLMGVSRYNPVPKQRKSTHTYQCLHCQKIILTQKKIGKSACAVCCKRYSGGRFDSRFLIKKIETGPS